MRVQAFRNVGELRIYAAQNKTNTLIIATSYKKYLENENAWHPEEWTGDRVKCRKDAVSSSSRRKPGGGDSGRSGYALVGDRVVELAAAMRATPRST
jgi:hypothetical protein